MDRIEAIGASIHQAELEKRRIAADRIAALEAELARVTKERDALMAKWAIESDESLTECVERNIDGWKQRCLRAEAAIEQARKEEREACALIADQWATAAQRQHGNGGPAAAIRARKP